VTAACGHPEKFGLFADRLDRFRADRRKKVTGRPCKACRAAKQLQEQEAAQARKAAGAENQRRSEQAGAAGAKRQPQGRLPDGAKFEVAYDGARVRWAGTLTVAGATFTGSAPALFTLLGRLDRLYRQSVAAPPREPDAPPP
jgi:hypothetical protein